LCETSSVETAFSTSFSGMVTITSLYFGVRSFGWSCTTCMQHPTMAFPLRAMDSLEREVVDLTPTKQYRR
jgi:hypothetical protein